MKDLRGQAVRRIKEKDILKFKKYFEKADSRMYALFNIGLNLGIRISDLINLKFEDIDADKKIYLIEKKTQKKKTLKLNRLCIEMIEVLKREYISRGLLPVGYLFKSYYRKFIKEKIDKPLSVVTVNKNLNIAKNQLKITYPVGTHSMRKTWAYTIYVGEKDIVLVMKMLNHSSQKQTLTYIGIEEETYVKIYERYVI